MATPIPFESLSAYARLQQPGGAPPLPSILLVDDDPHMIEVELLMLRSMGFQRTTSANGARQALSQLQADPHSADVIICDLAMPDMDGIEFLQTLNQSGFRGAVILLSGESTRVIHSVQKLLGGTRLIMLGALSKPAGRRDLRNLLDGWTPPVQPTTVVAARVFSGDELRTAHRQDQWVLHYQPQVQLSSASIAGVEALVRWQHPECGLVHPDRFIGTAEECGVIEDLTNWVMQQALQQQALWYAQGLRVQMAVNVSMENLRAPDFCQRVGNFLRAAQVAPQNVTLELTESRLMASSRIPLENLIRLRLQRLKLSIDDFGTGHSSLAQLRDVPFTELKIDRGFVRGARDNQIIRPMLEGSLAIAKQLGMSTVAEGVETEDDWRLLSELGCDFAQGYFIGRPMSAERLWDWLTLWRSRAPALIAARGSYPAMPETPVPG